MAAAEESKPAQQSLEERRTRDLELSDFLLRLCHDLRSPLRAIRAHAELLRKGSDATAAPDSAQLLGFIISGAENIHLLADGLSTYSLALRIDAGSFHPAQVDVLLRLTLTKLRKELQECAAEVTYDPLPRVWGNPDRLSNVLESLILNAIRHRGTAAPRVHLQADQKEHEWVFSVRDNGPGIEPAQLQRIFKPFERLRGKESPGPGLGLAIAREVVERHGGKIWAESQAGSGSTFFFTLPAR
ncbi:MAG TPA: ATP-binding protein [Bryobacteraceae bacterium]|jgi:signal transduction histidine kinase